MNFEQLLSSLASWAVNVGLKIVIALVILVVSFRVVTIVTRKIEKKLINGKPHLDKTLVSTLFYVLRIVVKSLIVVCLIGYLGIDTSGLTALFVSFGACVGLAVNGALSNLAGGVLIIVTRPFKIDDYIEAQGMSGTVEDIHITTTKLRTPDNKVVYIPNGPLSSGTIINYSEKELRRVDFNFSISYQNDFEKAKALVMDILNAHELVLKDPEPFVRVSSHADSSITVTARAWVKNADYWTVNFDVLESVKASFDASGIEIPYNQLDVHVKQG
ncbi:MAG: mechanosensitive ion channel [Clostridia bacterium]|nr:mechanosensitive ion channel [Clostridia bacterium]MBO5315051.1 mechanosensitive ion channel [Clostridia bacterium]MBR3805831.1 mechanosensitive ion channel [Clostridia bacterium]